ncbi:MAG: hypothetical protein MK110_16880 [Fuerstiella sp.]|nr:hypothetical protein [Fuerstiella sp.]
MDQSSTNAHVGAQGSDESYEVRRTPPRNGDSFVGGLDILTIHRMIEEQNAGSSRQESVDPG